MTRPLRIALTGGIASGKSAVSRQFALLGVPVIDADVAARAVVAPGTEGLRQLVAKFGDAILMPDGNLNRASLRQRIFSDLAAREAVNAILHPLIRIWMREQAERQPAPYQLFVIPLLVETGQAGDYDRVLVVEAKPTLRQQRLMARDGVSAEQASAIFASQADDGSRLAAATDRLDNNGDEASLAEQVESQHRRYLDLAHQRARTT